MEAPGPVRRRREVGLGEEPSWFPRKGSWRQVEQAEDQPVWVIPVGSEAWGLSQLWSLGIRAGGQRSRV